MNELILEESEKLISELEKLYEAEKAIIDALTSPGVMHLGNLNYVWYWRYVRNRPNQNVVYIIKNVDNGLIKIGKTTNIKNRIAQLKTAMLHTGNDKAQLQLLAIIYLPYGDGAINYAEKKLHTFYEDCQHCGEWFNITEQELFFSNDSIINTEYEFYGIHNNIRIYYDVFDIGKEYMKHHKFDDFFDFLPSISNTFDAERDIDFYKAKEYDCLLFPPKMYGNFENYKERMIREFDKSLKNQLELKMATLGQQEIPEDFFLYYVDNYEEGHNIWWNVEEVIKQIIPETILPVINSIDTSNYSFGLFYNPKELKEDEENSTLTLSKKLF